METKIYKEHFKNKMFLIIMAWPAGFVTISRTFIVRDISIKNNIGTIFIMLAIAMLLLTIICLLWIKKIIISDDYFDEKRLIGRKRFYYDKIETCFYDGTQDCICIIDRGKTKKILLGNYDQSDEILDDLQKHICIEMI